MYIWVGERAVSNKIVGMDRKTKNQIQVFWYQLHNTVKIMEAGCIDVLEQSTSFWDMRIYCLKAANWVCLIKKPTRYTNFSNLFFEWNSTCFGQFLCQSSGVFYCTHNNAICYTALLTACEQKHLLLLASCQQNCITYTTVVCTVKNSWWWIEKLSETCRVSFQK
jgi:hypothetical protein